MEDHFSGTHYCLQRFLSQSSPPLCHTAEIISPLTNRYIQLIEKTDYLLRALDPLFQKEVIPMEEYNLRGGLFKRHIKRFYYSCRRFDEGLAAG